MILFFRSLAPLTCNFSYIVFLCFFFLFSTTAAAAAAVAATLIQTASTSFSFSVHISSSLFTSFLFFVRVWSMYAVLYERMGIYVGMFLFVFELILVYVLCVFSVCSMHCEWSRGKGGTEQNKRLGWYGGGGDGDGPVEPKTRWGVKASRHQNDTYSRRKHGKK